jgi:ABC-type glutathione transport system ATPase component
MPGAVPIVAPTPASLGSGGIATPHEGTDPNASLLPACVGSLVSSSATPHAGVPLARAAGIGVVTECVRVPQRKRSTTILFVAGVLGVALAAAITVIVLGSGKVQSASADETAEKPVPAQQVTQGAGHPTEKTVAPPKAEQTDKIDKAKQPEKVEEPVTVTTFHEDAHEQLAPEIKVDPDPVKEAPAKAEPPKPPPKKTPPSPPKRPALVKTPPKPPVVKETPKKPKKEEPKKEEPKKEYNSDSPFLPVRPGGKENK